MVVDHGMIDVARQMWGYYLWDAVTVNAVRSFTIVLPFESLATGAR